MEHYEDFCLVSETSLKLVDRSLALGDVVKRNLSDASSGMVISTSLWCTLQPPSIEILDGRQSLAPEGLDQDRFSEEQSLCVPAQEIKFWKDYREDDYIIYQDWVGTVTDIDDEVTVRLSNGSVVVVDDPEELQEVTNAPGGRSEKHVKRLELAGYVRRRRRNLHKDDKKLWPAQPCFPGQRVVTKKGNLRRGRWIFGAYDSTIEPEGFVVEVRTIQLGISWAFPNVLAHEPQTLKNAPPSLLDIDILQSGDVRIYDHNRVPRNPVVPSLPNACHCQDSRFGLRVKFKDEAGAAVKYDGSTQDGAFRDWPFTDSLRIGRYRRIPRAETLGYDMNVLQINGTRTKVMVQWQDGSVTAEDSTSVVSYLNVDDHDLWLGEIVSSKDGEQPATGPGFDGSIRARRVGVVQSTDSIERVAKVRWFENPDVFIAGEDQSVLLSDSYLGPISNSISEVSLYDVVAYPALTKRRGDIVVMVPQAANGAIVAQAPSTTRFLINAIRNGIAMGTGGFSLMRRPVEAALQALRGQATEHTTSLRNGEVEHSSDIIDWFGEVVGLELDGMLTVRLGALPEARDVQVSVDRVIVVASGDDASFSGSDDGEDDSAISDDDVSMSTASHGYDSDEVIETTVEYEGGSRLDFDHDDEMWTTDDEDASSIHTPAPKNGSDELASSADDDLGTSTEVQEDHGSTSLVNGWHSIGSEVRFSNYSTMPPQFLVLDNSEPRDHHYSASPVQHSSSLIRRIFKEHKIMQNSLPDGIFVRTWESRLDLLRVLIVGPRNTPYELAPFVMDFHFSADFPKMPPDAHFHSWTGGIGRINPNLYENGKICLSLLGTWPGDERNESWSPTGSSMLQIIVSLMGLVLVKEPYYSKSLILLFVYYYSYDDLSAIGSSTTSRFTPPSCP